VLSILPLFVLWLIISGEVENHVLEQRLAELRSWTSMTAESLGDIRYFEDLPHRGTQNIVLDRDSRSFSSRIIVADSMGVVLHDTVGVLFSEILNSAWANPTMLLALDGNASYNVDTGTETLIQTVMPITIDGEVWGAVMLAHTMTEAGGIIEGITDQVLLLIIAIAITVAILVFLIASWLLSPLKTVSAAVKKVSEGHLGERVQIEGRGEIYDLSVAFNDMSQKLERTETARQEFVSNVSHELKTPLSGIKVLSESLLHQDNVEKETYKEFLTDIDSEVNRMADIINELLTLVRLDETEMPLNISDVDFNEMVASIIKRLTPLAQRRNIELEYNAESNVRVNGDEMKLTLAISNIIENAIKYSHDDGRVKVLIKGDAKNAFVTVTDEGIGIDEEDQSKVFARFYRADKGRDRETGGTGLGLAITHKTILLHKGGIKLTSALGEGSVFEVRIPRLR